MPKQYKKGKSNRLTHKTSIWTLVAKSRFGAIDDLRSMKAKEKLLRSVETKPNIPKKIEPLVKESVDKKIEYDDLQAYQEQQQLKRQLELDKNTTNAVFQGKFNFRPIKRPFSRQQVIFYAFCLQCSCQCSFCLAPILVGTDTFFWTG